MKIVGYDTSDGLYWLPKTVRVGEPAWIEQVRKSPVCPDQRKYRRLTRAERIRYESET